MPLEDVDILPSLWGVRRSGPALVDWFVRETAERSRETRSRLATEAQLDIRFGPGPRECVDLFGDWSSPKSSAVLFWHGGYWVEGERQSYSFVSEPFHEADVPVAVAGYPLAPAADLDHLVDSATRCARHLLALGNPLVLAGHSAGAQLAAAVAARIAHEDPEGVRGLLLLSPVLDVGALLGSSVATQAAIDLGHAMRNSPVRLTDGLPYGSRRFHVQVVLAERDPPWFRRTARTYCDDLAGRGVQCELLEYAGEDHFSYLLGPFLDAGHPVTRRIVHACSCTPS